MSTEQVGGREVGVKVVCPECGLEQVIDGQVIGMLGMPLCPSATCGLTRMENAADPHQGGDRE